MADQRFIGVPLEELRAMALRGDPEAASRAGQRLDRAATVLNQVSASLERAADQVGPGWRGRAAEVARTGIAGHAEWAATAGMRSAAAGAGAIAHAESAAYVRHNMPDPATLPQRAVPDGSPVGVNLARADEAWRNAQLRAVELLDGHAAKSRAQRPAGPVAGTPVTAARSGAVPGGPGVADHRSAPAGRGGVRAARVGSGRDGVGVGTAGSGRGSPGAPTGNAGSRALGGPAEASGIRAAPATVPAATGRVAPATGAVPITRVPGDVGPVATGIPATAIGRAGPGGVSPAVLATGPAVLATGPAGPTARTGDSPAGAASQPVRPAWFPAREPGPGPAPSAGSDSGRTGREEHDSGVLSSAMAAPVAGAQTLRPEHERLGFLIDHDDMFSGDDPISPPVLGA